MPVLATGQVGVNPYLNPGLPGFGPALEQIQGEGPGAAPGAPVPPPQAAPASIDLRSALTLATEIRETLESKPDWLALRLHSPVQPFLLGGGYV